MPLILCCINHPDEQWLSDCLDCIKRFPKHKSKWISTTPGMSGWLKARGIDADEIAFDIPQEGLLPRLERLEPIAMGPMLCSQVVPRTTLPMWKVLAHDRYNQFMHFAKSDKTHRLMDSIDFDVVITALDVHDAHAQYLMRLAKTRGVRSIGIQRGILRTKENLDAFYCFDRYIVRDELDKRFLCGKPGINPKQIGVSPDAQIAGLIQQLKLVSQDQIIGLKRALGMPESIQTTLAFFSIRHIWEMRAFLNALIVQGCPPWHLALYLEGQLEVDEAASLFQSEFEALKPQILTPETPLVHAILASDTVIAFRYGQPTEIAVRLGMKSIVFDPHGFNESKAIALNSNIAVLEDPRAGLHSIL